MLHEIWHSLVTTAITETCIELLKLYVTKETIYIYIYIHTHTHTYTVEYQYNEILGTSEISLL